MIKINNIVTVTGSTKFKENGKLYNFALGFLWNEIVKENNYD